MIRAKFEIIKLTLITKLQLQTYLTVNELFKSHAHVVALNKRSVVSLRHFLLPLHDELAEPNS